MKKHLLFFALGIVVIGSCGKIKSPVEELTTLEMESQKKQIGDIPPIDTNAFKIPTGGVVLPLPKFATATDAKKFFEENKTSPNFINWVKASKIYLSLVAPAGGNFDCMDKVKVYVSTTTGDEVLVGSKDNIPKGSNYIQTEPVDVDLKSYFIQDTVFFRVEPHLIGYPAANTQIEVGTTFKVSVTASKAL